MQYLGLHARIFDNIVSYCQNLYSPETMEQYTLKNVSNRLNTNIYSNLETSGGQSSNLFLNVIHFFNTSVN